MSKPRTTITRKGALAAVRAAAAEVRRWQRASIEGSTFPVGDLSTLEGQARRDVRRMDKILGGLARVGAAISKGGLR